jgi:hypothetical protein
VHASSVYLSAQVLKTGVVLADLPGRNSPKVIGYEVLIKKLKIRLARYQFSKSTSNADISHEV